MAFAIYSRRFTFRLFFFFAHSCMFTTRGEPHADMIHVGVPSVSINVTFACASQWNITCTQDLVCLHADHISNGSDCIKKERSKQATTRTTSGKALWHVLSKNFSTNKECWTSSNIAETLRMLMCPLQDGPSSSVIYVDWKVGQRFAKQNSSI